MKTHIAEILNIVLITALTCGVAASIALDETLFAIAFFCSAIEHALYMNGR